MQVDEDPGLPYLSASARPEVQKWSWRADSAQPSSGWRLFPCLPFPGRPWEEGSTEPRVFRSHSCIAASSLFFLAHRLAGTKNFKAEGIRPVAIREESTWKIVWGTWGEESDRKCRLGSNRLNITTIQHYSIENCMIWLAELQLLEVSWERCLSDVWKLGVLKAKYINASLLVQMPKFHSSPKGWGNKNYRYIWLIMSLA